MGRQTLARTAAAAAALLVLTGACTTGAAAPTSPAAVAPAATTVPTASSAPATPDASPVALADIADLLVLQAARPTPGAGYTVLGPGRGNVMFTITDGLPSRDWQTLVSTAADGARTIVTVTRPEEGTTVATVAVPGAWRLPTVGVAHAATGLSADGSTLVLEEATGGPGVPAAGPTRFAIVSTARGTERIVTLDGAFSFDVLSPDGGWLYLLETVPGADPGAYRVRRLDVPTGRLEAGTIVDKRAVDEPMSGLALTQVIGDAGWSYTLYRGAAGLFVHALDTAHGVAFCIDLPDTGGRDAGTDAAWGLAADARGGWLYVADTARSTVSAISFDDFSVRRSARVASLTGIRLAKLEYAWAGGGRAVLSPDGATLYVAAETGVAAIRTTDLVTVGHLGGSGAYHAVAAGRGGAVYAVDAAGRALRLGTGSDAAVPVAPGAFASIVAVGP
jgi:hypothetical protein